MAPVRPAEPVDPALLLQAFLIVGGYWPDKRDEPRGLTKSEAARLLDRISGDLETSPQVTMDLFRRCCALANFLSVASNRYLVDVEEGAKPGSALLAAAASAPVRRVILDDMASGTFDPREFAAAVRRWQD